jgi:flagellar biosynthetic protein FliS
MEQRLRDYYIDSQVNNATPGQLLVMLYDCLIEHAEAANQELSVPKETANIVLAAREVSWCIKMITELNTSLRRSVNPELCTTLSDLYLFFMRQFSDALEKHEPAKIREVLPLIRRLRGTWAEADRRANKNQAGSIAIAA